jgi:hypothetical protein
MGSTPGTAPWDRRAPARHSDAAHSDAAHSDAAHSDAAHSDAAHSDAAHSDAAHSDAASSPASRVRQQVGLNLNLHPKDLMPLNHVWAMAIELATKPVLC